MPETQDLTQDSLAVRNPARRTIVKGAAWAVPAVTIASAAPAMANSPIPPNGLNGWVELQRNCGTGNNNYQFRIDGRGSFPNRGIWTFIEDPNATIQFAQIVFFFNRNNLVFENQSQSGWTNLVRNTGLDGTSPAPGYYAYGATYTGGWTYFTNLGQPRWEANGDPFWRIYRLGNCSNGVTGYARRTITVNGETVTFTRGPVSV